MKKSKLTLEERQRINFYKLCISCISQYPQSSYYVCIAASSKAITIEEYELFRDNETNYSWLVAQVSDLMSEENDYGEYINTYRIFILQLCIEMIKNK